MNPVLAVWLYEGLRISIGKDGCILFSWFDSRDLSQSLLILLTSLDLIL